MARRRRRSFNLRKVRIFDSLAAGALAAADVVSGVLVPSSITPYRVTSVQLSYSFTDIGATQDDGQEFGLAHSDYTAAEIEECLEIINSVDQGNKIAQEQANRLVRTIGMMQGAPGTGASKSFNNGVPKKTKLNWYIGNGDGINIWIRNGSGTIWTAGAQLTSLGHMWIKQPA